MDSKIVNLETKTESNRSLLAKVIEVENAEATTIHILELSRKVSVFAHSSSVPALSVGDRILVEGVESGYIVTHRLRGKGEKPQQGFDVNADDSLQVTNGNGIVMRVNGAKIEILQDGRVLIEGKELYSIAEGKCRLQGSTVELN